MGGSELDEHVGSVLTVLQKKLNSVLDKLSGEFVATLEPHIHEQTMKLGVLLTKIKGPQLQKAQVQPEADAVLEPLMDLLEGSLRRYADQCEKTVLKYILKELWKITIVNMEKRVVLPPLSDKALLKQLPNAKIGDVTKLMSTNIQNIKGMNSVKDMMDMARECEKSLTPKQCTVLDCALDAIKDSFHASGKGLKKSFFEKSPELQSLKYALSLYTQTTEQLIKTFITSQRQQGILLNSEYECIKNVFQIFRVKNSRSEKSVCKSTCSVIRELASRKLPSKVSTLPADLLQNGVLVLAANDLRWQTSSAFKPFVEVHLVGPHLSDKKRKCATKSKPGNWAPKFNETFHLLVFFCFKTFSYPTFSFLGNEGEPEHYELMFQVKDYCFAREDRIVGVGVLQLSSVVDQGKEERDSTEYYIHSFSGILCNVGPTRHSSAHWRDRTHSSSDPIPASNWWGISFPFFKCLLLYSRSQKTSFDWKQSVATRRKPSWRPLQAVRTSTEPNRIQPPPSALPLPAIPRFPLFTCKFCLVPPRTSCFKQSEIIPTLLSFLRTNGFPTKIIIVRLCPFLLFRSGISDSLFLTVAFICAFQDGLY